MLVSVSRHRLGFAKRWISASSAKKQLDFPKNGETAVQDYAVSQPEPQPNVRGAREDPSYERWLATTGRQYKRPDCRNWLGGSVVCLHVYFIWVTNLNPCSPFR